jgi:hypothetical protein
MYLKRRVLLEYLAKLWECVYWLYWTKKDRMDIGPKMLPVRVIALRNSTSEKVSEVAPFSNDRSLTVSPHGLATKFENPWSILHCVTIHNMVAENFTSATDVS